MVECQSSNIAPTGLASLSSQISRPEPGLRPVLSRTPVPARAGRVNAYGFAAAHARRVLVNTGANSYSAADGRCSEPWSIYNYNCKVSRCRPRLRPEANRQQQPLHCNEAGCESAQTSAARSLGRMRHSASSPSASVFEIKRQKRQARLEGERPTFGGGAEKLKPKTRLSL